MLFTADLSLQMFQNLLRCMFDSDLSILATKKVSKNSNLVRFKMMMQHYQEEKPIVANHVV